MFHKADVVNYYICALNPSVRELVAQHVRIMSLSHKVNLEVVKKAAMAIGKSQRALSTREMKKESNNRGDSQKITRRPVKSGK